MTLLLGRSPSSSSVQSLRNSNNPNERRLSLVEDPLLGWQADTSQKSLGLRLSIYKDVSPAASASATPISSPPAYGTKFSPSLSPSGHTTRLLVSSGSGFVLPSAPTTSGTGGAAVAGSASNDPLDENSKVMLGPNSLGLAGRIDSGGKPVGIRSSVGGFSKSFDSVSPIALSPISPIVPTYTSPEFRSKPLYHGNSLKRSALGNELKVHESSDKDSATEEKTEEPEETGFYVLPDDEFLPFRDRPLEVQELIKSNKDLFRLIKKMLDRPHQQVSSGALLDPNSHSLLPPQWNWSDFMAHIRVPRVTMGDEIWIKKIKECIEWRSEAVWNDLRQCLGADLEDVAIAEGNWGAFMGEPEEEEKAREAEESYGLKVNEIYEGSGGEEEEEYGVNMSPISSFSYLSPPSPAAEFGGNSPGTLQFQMTPDGGPAVPEGVGNCFMTGGSGRDAKRHSRNFSGSLGGNRFMGPIDESQEVSDFSSEPVNDYASSVASFKSYHSANSNSSRRIVALHLTSISPSHPSSESPKNSQSQSTSKIAAPSPATLSTTIKIGKDNSGNYDSSTPVKGSPKNGSLSLSGDIDSRPENDKQKERRKPRIQYSFGSVPKSPISDELSKGWASMVVSSPMDYKNMDSIKGEKKQSVSWKI